MVGACRPSGSIWIHAWGRTREDSFAISTRILPSRRRRALLAQEPAEFQDAVGPTEDATQGRVGLQRIRRVPSPDARTEGVTPPR
jgi:hypothetical protein